MSDEPREPVTQTRAQPLCRDCRWFRSGVYGYKCHEPRLVKTSLVWGPESYSQPAGLMRAMNDQCGPAGAWFQPKPRPWWKFWHRSPSHER